MPKRNNFYQQNKYLIWAFLAPFFILEGIAVVMGVQPFGDNSFLIVDALHQYLPFFADYHDKLKSLDNLFYSFHGGLGYNFLGLWAYYLSSPLNLVIVLFPKEMLNMVLSHLYIIKIALCGLTAAYYFRSRDKKRQDISIVAFGLCYALSSYIVGYSWNIMWLEVMMMLPLILVGMDRLIKKRDGRLYCGALFFSLLCNFYMSFMTCLFLVLWYLLYDHKKVKAFFVNGLKFAGYSLLSAMMAGAVLLPAYLGIMKTSSAKWDFPKDLWYGNFADLYCRHFLGTAPITNSVNDGEINLYCGILTLVFVLFYFMASRISWKTKIKRALLMLFLFFSFNVPLLGYIWHGFHNQYGIPNRFAYLYIFLLLIMAYDGLLVIKREGRQQAWKLCISCGILCMSVGIASLLNTKAFDRKVLAFTTAAIFLYLVVFVLYDRKTLSRRGMVLICSLLLVIEAAGMAVYGFSENGQVRVSEYFGDTKNIQTVKNKYKTGPDQRMELIKGRMLDESIWHTLDGVTMFGSTALGDVVDMMDDLGFYTGVNEYLYEGATPFTNNLLGVRYNLLRTSDTNTTDFQYLDRIGDINVYGNPYNTAVGYGMKKSAYKWKYDDVNPFLVQNRLSGDAFGGNDIFHMIKTEKPKTNACKITQSNDGEYVFENTASLADNMTFEIPVTEDGKLYFHFDGSQVEDTVIYRNNEVYVSGRLNAQCIYLGDLKKGDHITVSMRLKQDDLMSGVVRVTLASLDEDAMKDLYGKMQEQAFQLEEADSSTLKGTVSMNEDGLVFFSIPYDKGWKVLVDGKETEVNSLGKAFLCVDVSEGKHEIELEYCPEGFKEGIILTALGWLIFASICLRKRKKSV